MPNKKIRQQGIALDVALCACHSDTAMVSEFRRYALRQFGVNLGSIFAFAHYAGPQHNFCLVFHNAHFYVASETLTASFLEAFSCLAARFLEKLNEVFERIDHTVFQHYYLQLKHREHMIPSTFKLTFCRRYLGVNQSLAMLACLLAENASLDESQQRLGISRHTLRTYLQRLVKHCGARDKNELILHLKDGPLPWLQ